MKPSLLLFLLLASFYAHASTKSHSLHLMENERYITDLRYNTDQNFLKKNVYKPFGLHQCYLHADLKEKVDALQNELKQSQLKLVFWDCYRPLEVQKAMWDIVPDSRFVANPKFGSNHNRGIAMDVSLADEDGSRLPMPTEFDDFSAKAAPTYKCGIEEKQKCVNRDLLIQMMQKVGLKPLSSEWWHFQLPNTRKYPLIQNLR